MITRQADISEELGFDYKKMPTGWCPCKGCAGAGMGASTPGLCTFLYLWACELVAHCALGNHYLVVRVSVTRMRTQKSDAR